MLHVFSSHSWLVLPQISSPHHAICPCASSKIMCRIYSSDKHALCFLPLRCLLFSEERSDLFIFMGCSLAKNITAMKGSFNRSWACWFGRWTLPWLNSVVSHDSFLTRSSFAATDSECTHSACQAVARFFGWGLGPGGLPALWLYLWCAQHTSYPHPPWNSSWGLYDL